MLVGSNVSALRYMNREINDKKEANLTTFDLKNIDTHNLKRGREILTIDKEDKKNSKNDEKLKKKSKK